MGSLPLPQCSPAAWGERRAPSSPSPPLGTAPLHGDGPTARTGGSTAQAMPGCRVPVSPSPVLVVGRCHGDGEERQHSHKPDPCWPPSSGPAASSLRAQHQPLSLWMSDTVPTEELSLQLSRGCGCPVTPQLPSTSHARSPSPRSPWAGAVGTRLSLPQHRGTVLWGHPCPSQGCPSVPPRACWHQDAVAPGCRAADGPGAGGQPTALRWPERGAARRGGGRRSWRYLPGTKRRHRLLK